MGWGRAFVNLGQARSRKRLFKKEWAKTRQVFGNEKKKELRKTVRIAFLTPHLPSSPLFAKFDFIFKLVTKQNIFAEV